jgi:hypothetical protein
MYLDLWRILRKQISESYSNKSNSEIVRMMNELERRMIADVNWERSAHKGLKHLRKIDSYYGLNEEYMENSSSLEN